VKVKDFFCFYLIVYSVFFSYTLVYSAPDCSGWAPGNTGLAIIPNTNKAYISFSLDDALVQVDLDDLSVSSCIDVSSSGSLLLSTIARATPDGKHVFVANYGTENITVVDTATNKVVKALPIAAQWGDSISVSNDGSRVYVSGVDNVYVINTSDLTYQPVSGLYAMAIVPSANDPDILYCIGGDETQRYLFTYNLGTQSVIRTTIFPPDVLPNDVGVDRFVVNGAENYAYIGWCALQDNRGYGNLIAFNLDDFTVVSSTPMENGVTDFALNPTLGKIYVAGIWSGGEGPGTLNIIEWDTTSHTISRTLPIPDSSDQRAIRVDPLNSNYLYLTEGDYNYLAKIEISTGNIVNRVDLSNKGIVNPTGFVGGDGFGYVFCLSTPKIFKINLSTGCVVNNLLLPGGMPGSNGGGYHNGFLYIDDRQKIYKINAVNGALEKEYPIAADILFEDMTFFADKMVAIDYYPGTVIARKLYLFNTEDFQIVNSIDLPYEVYGEKIFVSEDGTKLFISGGSMTGPTTISILDSASLTTLKTIEVAGHGSGNNDYFFDSLNNRLYLTGFDAVFVIDTTTDTLVNILELRDVLALLGQPNSPRGTGLTGMTPSPDKRYLYILSYDTHVVYTYDLSQNHWLPDIIDVGGYTPMNLLLSPDQSHLYCVNTYSDTVSIISSLTRELEEIIDLKLDFPWSMFLPAMIHPSAQVQGQ
jgi:YVTN family beta-propeller protein